MYWAPDIADAAFTAALLTLLPASAIILTPKRSIIRYIAIICCVLLTSRFMQPVIGSSTIRTIGSTQLVLTTIQAINVLVLNPLDQNDIAQEVPKAARSRFARLYHAAEAVVQLRAINTPRQIKNVPAYPSYYSTRLREGAIPRRAFLRRQILIFIWQYLALDLLQTAARLQASPQTGATSDITFTHVDYHVPLEKWIERMLKNLINWFLLSRIIIDANYRFLSIMFVGFGGDSPVNWPPLFGRMADAYTVRNFWGKFWHQLLRGPFTAVTNFIARDILNLPRPSLLERYTNIFLVFGISGVLHVLVDHLQAIPSEYSGAMIMFPITAFAVMFEDGVQELWRRLTHDANTSEPQKKTTSPPLWHRIVGYLWTMAWLGVVSEWYLHPMTQLPPELTTTVPVSLVGKIGLAPIGGTLLGTGLLLAYFLKAEL